MGSVLEVDYTVKYCVVYIATYCLYASSRLADGLRYSFSIYIKLSYRVENRLGSSPSLSESGQKRRENMRKVCSEFEMRQILYNLQLEIVYAILSHT